MASSKPLLAQFAFLYTFGHFEIEIEREEVESEAEAYDPFQYACPKKIFIFGWGGYEKRGTLPATKVARTLLSLLPLKSAIPNPMASNMSTDAMRPFAMYANLRCRTEWKSLLIQRYYSQNVSGQNNLTEYNGDSPLI